jgi:hypothetical protein
MFIDIIDFIGIMGLDSVAPHEGPATFRSPGCHRHRAVKHGLALRAIKSNGQSSRFGAGEKREWAS